MAIVTLTRGTRWQCTPGDLKILQSGSPLIRQAVPGPDPIEEPLSAEVGQIGAGRSGRILTLTDEIVGMHSVLLLGQEQSHVLVRFHNGPAPPTQ